MRLDDDPNELVDAGLAHPEAEARIAERLPLTRCDTDWCVARRKRRVAVSRHDPEGRLEYPECGDAAGDYAGLTHRNRVRRALGDG